MSDYKTYTVELIVKVQADNPSAAVDELISMFELNRYDWNTMCEPYCEEDFNATN